MIWFGLALAALLIEIFSGTFYLLVFCVSLLITGILDYFLATSLNTNLIICGVLSLIGIILVTWFHLKNRRRSTQEIQDDNLNLGQQVVILSRGLGDLYQVQYRGTQWQARLSVANGADLSGQSARIVGHDGNVLIIDLIN